MDQSLSIRLGNSHQEVSLLLELNSQVVFSPTFTGRAICEEMLKFNLKGKKVLDFGCGSGLIAVSAALCGAEVLALDVNPDAVETTIRNARLNGVCVEGIVSDCFGGVADRDFDYIIANGPGLPADISITQNTPVSNGDGGRAHRAVIGEGGQYLAPHGAVVTWSQPWLQSLGALDWMRESWAFVECARRYEVMSGTDADQGVYRNADLKALARQGMLAERAGGYFMSCEIYHLKNPRLSA